MTKFRSVSLRLGYLGNICYAFLFFPVTRLSSILPLVGLTSESSIKYHIWLGHVSMALAILHSVGFVLYYAVSNQMIEVISTHSLTILFEVFWRSINQRTLSLITIDFRVSSMADSPEFIIFSSYVYTQKEKIEIAHIK